MEGVFADVDWPGRQRNLRQVCGLPATGLRHGAPCGVLRRPFFCSLIVLGPVSLMTSKRKWDAALGDVSVRTPLATHAHAVGEIERE